MEPRRLLATGPLITEFMASNDGSHRDGDGKSPDWIEIHNPTDQPIDLAGYRLTDQSDDLDRWVFPSVAIPPRDYLVVFASGQESDEYVDAEGNLHTSFSLKAGGEYLALVQPDNSIISQFGSTNDDYPPQRQDISYGRAQGQVLFGPEDQLQYWIPANASIDATWTDVTFDDEGHGFQSATARIGYESRPGSRSSFSGEITSELPERTISVYARMEFEIDDVESISGLRLRLKYDNGFVAYMNGQQIASMHAPDVPSWFSFSTDARRSDAEALQFEEFDVSQHIAALQPGKNVLAIHGLNSLSDDSDMLLVPELVASLSGETGELGYMPPTPGVANVSSSSVNEGFVADVQYNIERGFYDAPFELALTSDTPGATIRYTTDGGSPEDGEIYSVPIRIDTTSTIRAVAVKPNHFDSTVDTHTYVFVEDVIHQPQDPTGYPSRWNGGGAENIAADYEMDPEVVNDPAYADEIIDGLLDIPTISLVTNPDDMFGDDRGLYIHSARARGTEWERETSLEIIEPGGETFQAQSGLRIHGYSWRQHAITPKHSFRLEFSREYGPSKLEYPMFPDAPVDRFDSIVLRAQGGRAWAGNQVTHQAQYMRDVFARDTARDMGKIDGHAAYFHLYLNGLYWGLYHAVERPDAQMAEEYFGGSDEDYDALNRRTTTNEAIDGDLNRYNEMLRLADRGLTTPEAYAEIERYVDIENMIDFFLIHQYTTNQDGPETFQSNNQRALGSRVGDPKFRFFVWDMEYSIWDADDNFNIDVNVPGSISRVYTKLRENPEFEIRYADRAHKQLFNGGALTADAAATRWETRANEIYRAIISESARWGDAKRNAPYTRDVEWQRERERLLTEYFPVRTEIMIQQLRDAGLYPELDAPVFQQHGGAIPADFQLSMWNPSNRGQVYYTLDGTDPRLAGGSVSPNATLHDGREIPLGNEVNVRARVWNDGSWSALNEASFFVVEPDSPYHLRISEINFSPSPANSGPGQAEPDVKASQFEFVELRNPGTQTIDLGGVQLTRGIEFVVPNGESLLPGEHLVIAKDIDAFQGRYGPEPRVAGEFIGDLSNNGELVELRTADGQLIQSVSYQSRGELARANGLGSTLVAVEPDENETRIWRASNEFGGSPGRKADTKDDRIIVNEILPHTDDDRHDVIELRNTTDSPVSIGGWFLSNREDDYFVYRIPSETVIASRDYYLVDSSELGFDLNSWSGDQVWLVSADDRSGRPSQFVDHVSFGPTARNVTVGPTESLGDSFLPLAEATLGRQNSGPAVGDVVITEVHYAPLDPDGDRSRFRDEEFRFIELYNTTDAQIDLTGWELRGTINVELSDGARIGPRQTALVVSFAETDVNKSTVFRFQFGIDDSAPIVGSFGRRDLKEDEVELTLVKPERDPAERPGLNRKLYVERIEFTRSAPWPTDVIATGKSIQRTSPAGLGDRASSWTSLDASPGSVDFVMRVVGDSNDDGRFDSLDIVRVLQSGKYLSGLPARWEEGDWNGDGVFDQEDLVTALQASTYQT